MRANRFAPLLALFVVAPTSPQQRGPSPAAIREVLQRYIRGCNAGDTTLLKSTLAPDVTVYFLNRAPVSGRDAVVTMWKGYHDSARPRWSIDDVVVDGAEAVMEWSARRDRPLGPHGFDRGVDWYVFRDGLIAEIRQYYDSRGTVPMDQVYEQRGFPYAQRGYPTAATLDSKLP